MKGRVAAPPRSLGAGRWRIDVELEEEGAPFIALERDRVGMRAVGVGDLPEVEVEAVSPPPAGAPGTWGLVVAVGGAPGAQEGLTLELEVSGADLDLPPRVVLGDRGLDEPAPLGDEATPVHVLPTIDYTARDFDAIRTAMLDGLRSLVGPEHDQSPVAQTTALVEALAYLADGLSYAQDAVATEAYLTTARRRISVGRHARLLGYEMKERVSARTWIRVEGRGDQPFTLPARTQLLTAVAGIPVRISTDGEIAVALARGALVFETVSDLEVHPEPALLDLQEAVHPGGRLPHGATSATVGGHHDSLEPGDPVLLQASGPGVPEGHVVRLVSVEPLHLNGDPVTRLAWRPSDALPPRWSHAGTVQLSAGNLVLAEHGRTIPRPHSGAPESVLPPPIPGTRYWPRLPEAPVAFRRDDGDGAAGPGASGTVGRSAPALPAIEIEEYTPSGPRRWTPRTSLLDSAPSSPDFVAEIDNDGSARLRFGDGSHGLRPPLGTLFRVRYRVGGGAEGNVAPRSIRHVVTDDPRVARATNPVAAVGGSDPESTETVRVRAPQAYRENERAVTRHDVIRLALRQPGVVDADCAWRSSGSWPVAIVPVQLSGGWDASLVPLEAVQRFLATRLAAGTEVDVCPAAPLPAAIEIDIAVAPGWEPGMVRLGVDDALRRSLLAPLTFRFGTPLYRSTVIRALVNVPGVSDVTIRRFGVVNGTDRDVIMPGFGRVIRIDNEPSTPEHGSVRYRLIPSEH